MIEIKSEDEIKLMRHSGKIAYELLSNLKDLMKPGKTTKELEEKIQEMQNFKDKISHVIKNFKENIKVGKNGEICGLIENLFQE